MNIVYGKNIVFACCFAALTCLSLNAKAMNIEELTVVAAGEVKPATDASQDMPMGQAPEGEVSLLPEDVDLEDDSDLFGLRGGYVHPYITIEGSYTDNVFNVPDETSSFIGRVAPGIWFSLPRTKEIPIVISPHNTSPGGLQQQIKDYEGTDRYQAYALAGLNYKAYSENSDLNDTDAEVEGLFRWNMRGGLSLQALDSFNYTQDRFEAGSASRGNLRRNYSNLFMGTADYSMTEKLRLKLDYSNFWLDYKDDINAFLDRTDNSLDLYGYFLFSIKTSIFLQYRFGDVAYDSADQKDNTQHYWYGGMTWETTDKLSLTLKGGYQSREYEDSATADGYDWDGVVANLQTLYRWTPKTEFTLDAYRKSEESDSTVAVDKLVFGLNFGYRQEYTEKLTGVLSVMFENADYSQIDGSSRDEDRYYLRPAIQYLFREWMMAELAYMFDKRDSTDDLFDYTTNMIMFNVNLSM